MKEHNDRGPGFTHVEDTFDNPVLSYLCSCRKSIPNIPPPSEPVQTVNAILDKLLTDSQAIARFDEFDKEAKSSLLKLLLDLPELQDVTPHHVMGEYDDYSMCMICDRVIGDDTDYSSRCLCQTNNKVKADIRTALKRAFGAEEGKEDA